jgi:hypothetical protein
MTPVSTIWIELTTGAPGVSTLTADWVAIGT